MQDDFEIHLLNVNVDCSIEQPIAEPLIERPVWQNGRGGSGVLNLSSFNAVVYGERRVGWDSTEFDMLCVADSDAKQT